MSSRILTLEFLTILIYHVVSGSLVHQVNGLVSNDIFLVAILYVYLSQVLTVVTLSLRQHPALLIVLEPLLKLVGILNEFDECPLVLVPLGKEPDTVALADYSSDSTFFIIITILVILIIVVIISKKQTILILSLQEVLLLFRRK